MKRVRQQPRMDLDELLTGSPSWERVVEFWKADDFCEERYLVAAIKKYLQTPEQAAQIATMGLTIEDMLNGRYGGQHDEQVYAIYAAWNEKLGYKAFGS